MSLKKLFVLILALLLIAALSSCTLKNFDDNNEIVSNANENFSENSNIPDLNAKEDLNGLNFLDLADMKRRGEELPEGVMVSLEPTPNGGVFSVAFIYGNQMEIHECDEEGNVICRTYGYINDTE